MRITRITIENFFSIKEAIIDIQDGKTLITGINLDDDGADNSGVGKSSVISAVGWAIFGEVPKNIPVDKVIRFGTSNTFVCVEFDDGTFIKRRRGTKTALDFYYKNEPCEGRTVSIVQQEIFKKFGMKGTPKQCFLDFLNTVYLNSSTVETFSSSEFSSADRFQFISRIFNLDIWKKASELAKKDKDKINTELETVRLKLEANEEFFVGITEEGLRAELRFLNEKVEESDKNIKEFNVRLDKINEKNRSGDGLRNTLILAQSDLVNFHKEVTDKEMAFGYRIQALEEGFERKNKAYDEILSIRQGGENTLADDNAVERITGKIKNFQKEFDEFQEIRIEHSKNSGNVSHELDDLKKQIEETKRCPHCNETVLVSNGKLIHYDPNEARKLWDKKKEEILLLHKEEEEEMNKSHTMTDVINEGQKALEESKVIRERIKSLQEVVDEIEIDSDEEILDLKAERQDYKDEMQENSQLLEDKISEAQEEFDAFETIDTTQIEQDLEDLIKLKDEENLNLGGCKQTIEDFLAHNKRVIDLICTLEALTGDITSSKYWTRTFIDIRRMIIESSIPRLESTINTYLKKLQMPMQVIIETLKEVASTGKLKEEFNINVLDLTNSRLDTIETYSDGQKKRIGLAVCFALNDFLKDRAYPFDFLLIDQLLDTDIDEVGVGLVMEILDSMPNQKLIISHKTELKDKFNNVIWLEKKSGITKVA